MLFFFPVAGSLWRFIALYLNGVIAVMFFFLCMSLGCLFQPFKNRRSIFTPIPRKHNYQCRIIFYFWGTFTLFLHRLCCDPLFPSAIIATTRLPAFLRCLSPCFTFSPCLVYSLPLLSIPNPPSPFSSLLSSTRSFPLYFFFFPLLLVLYYSIPLLLFYFTFPSIPFSCASCYYFFFPFCFFPSPVHPL